jgi:Raf kinase inhibitor-like YbhB/YbcL family protein
MSKNSIISLIVLAMALLIPGLANTDDKPAKQVLNNPEVTKATPSFRLSSLSFGNSQTIQSRYSYNMKPQCSGDNLSPALIWTGAPAGTKSFAVIMHDPDGGNWTHWVQFNISSGMKRLDEAKSGPAIGIKGSNSFGGTGYAGPCPPSDNITHRYIFTLYALDLEMDLPTGATREQLQKAMAGHVLGKAVLVGIKKRD